MAKQKSFTDEYGEVYPASYWRVTTVVLNKEESRASISFRGYPSVEQKGKRMIGRVEYSVNPEDYNVYFALSVLDQDTNPIKQAYLYAMEASVLVFGGIEKGLFFENSLDV